MNRFPIGRSGSARLNESAAQASKDVVVQGEKRARKPLTLRSLTRVFGVVLAVVAVGTAAALVAITTYLHGLTREVSDSLQSVRAAEQIELQLLLHSRELRLASLTTSEAHGGNADLAVNAIRHWQRVARKYVGSPDEARVNDELDTALQRYFAHASTQSDSLVGSEAKQADAFADAQGLAEKLLDINLAQAREGQLAAAYWDTVSTITGLAIAGLVLLTVLVLIMATEKQVHAPLLELQRSITGFVNEGQVRAPLHGPFEVREIARVFNEMADTIEHQRQRQLGFIAGVAHDLRNPLAALKMALGTIPPANPHASQEQAAWTVAMIGRQVDLLTRMISDLLDAVRVEAGQLELRFENHDLRDLVQHVVALFSPLSERHELQGIAPAEAVVTRCDPARLEQVLNNLVSNAIKYSPDGGRVEVRLEAQWPQAVVSVTDNGLGIPEEEHLRIFEPFRRGDASRESIPGVGIGLAVAKRIVEAHGGTLGVCSSFGQGSTFTVRLPLAAEAAPAAVA